MNINEIINPFISKNTLKEGLIEWSKLLYHPKDITSDHPANKFRNKLTGYIPEKAYYASARIFLKTVLTVEFIKYLSTGILDENVFEKYNRCDYNYYSNTIKLIEKGYLLNQVNPE